MKNNIITLLIIFLSISLNAQDKYITRNGNINFEASVATFEAIKASNKSVTALLNTKNGGFATLVLIRGFKFKIALMEEHFNENYMESDDFPKATFKGTLLDFDLEKIKTQSNEYILEGALTIHDKTQKIKTLCTLKFASNKILMNGVFKINLADYDIKIPSIVKGKISEEVTIDLNFELSSKN
jgi:polyisoprenoid-binding protein YceI